jgi:NTP pyrophosphatase (non-canonical NTP hydrolase)
MTNTDRLSAVTDRLREFARERDWEKFHNPKNLAMAIASEAGELAAELRWVPDDDSDEFVRDPSNRVRVEYEVADIAISLISFCDRGGIDLIGAIMRKIELNDKNYPASSAKGKPDRP